MRTLYLFIYYDPDLTLIRTIWGHSNSTPVESDFSYNSILLLNEWNMLKRIEMRVFYLNDSLIEWIVRTLGGPSLSFTLFKTDEFGLILPMNARHRIVVLVTDSFDKKTLRYETKFTLIYVEAVYIFIYITIL